MKIDKHVASVHSIDPQRSEKVCCNQKLFDRGEPSGWCTAAWHVAVMTNWLKVLGHVFDKCSNKAICGNVNSF